MWQLIWFVYINNLLNAFFGLAFFKTPFLGSKSGNKRALSCWKLLQVNKNFVPKAHFTFVHKTEIYNCKLKPWARLVLNYKSDQIFSFFSVVQCLQFRNQANNLITQLYIEPIFFNNSIASSSRTSFNFMKSYIYIYPWSI